MCEKCAEKNREIRMLREEQIALRRRISVLELQLDCMRSPDRPEYLTTEQAAKVLQLSIAQIGRYIRDVQLTAVQLAEGGSWRIPYKAFVAFIGSHTVEAMEALPV